MKKTRKIIIIVISISLSFNSCISRLGRPEIIGIITDYENKPIVNCNVGETVSDNEGRFVLCEKRYKQFLLSELFQMEAPPLYVSEKIEKEGFEPEEIHVFSSYGGGCPKGAKYEMDTIRLKKIATKFNPVWLLNQKWNVSATKGFDTLYFINEQFLENCKIKKCYDFYSKYASYEDNYLYIFGPNNLPDSVIRQYIVINFSNNNQFNLKRTRVFGNKNRNKFGDNYMKMKPDSLFVRGKWTFMYDSLKFESTEPSLSQMNKTYNIDIVNLYFFRATKAPL